MSKILYIWIKLNVSIYHLYACENMHDENTYQSSVIVLNDENISNPSLFNSLSVAILSDNRNTLA